MNFKNKKILITGATGGIGNCFVEKFNDFYVSSGAKDLNWAGVPMIKNPCDIWMVVELFQKLIKRTDILKAQSLR